MGTIAVHEFMSLDGVFENPSWTFEYGFDPEMAETIGSITSGAKAILLGRTTFEMFAPAWSSRTAEDDPGAPFFNDTKKYVVGAQTPSVEWSNTILLGAYDPAVLGKLKADTDGVIYVSGSGTLVRALLGEGLVDELHLFVYPVALGAGKRLWADGEGPTKLALRAQRAYENGVLHLAYAPAAGG